MIRIQLVHEGRVVKQITSRVHESVVLEQIKKFKDPYDEIYIVEGELSEDAKGMLKHVARKIVPAAMAAGLALGNAHADPKWHNYGNNGTPGVNKDFPALNYSPGQYLQQAIFNAQQRARGGDASVSPQQFPQATKVYDQSRVSQDGRFYIIYDMDNKITRVPVQGTEFMAGDSQRMPHYITANGQVMYVRHPHNNGLGESLDEGMGTIGTTPTIPTSNSAPNPGNKPQFDKTGSTTNAKFNANGELELEDDEDGKLSPESIEQLKKAGVKVAEAVEPGLQSILDKFAAAYADFKSGGDIDNNPDFYEALFHYFSDNGEMPYGTQKARDGDPINWLSDKLDSIAGAEPVAEGRLLEYLVQGGDSAEAVTGLNLFQDFDAEQGLTAQYDDFASSPEWRMAEKKYAPIAHMLQQKLAALGRPLTDAEANAIDDTWYDGSDAYDSVEVNYLTNIYDNQIDKIEALLAGNLTDEEFGESIDDEDEASPAEIAGADKNIIMQIRKASDYEKPTQIELADGSTINIVSSTAKKILAQFDRLKPDTKELMQQTLNTAEGFREILNFFNEREVVESEISIQEQAQKRARQLIKSVFGNI